MFDTAYDTIQQNIHTIDPVAYGRTRNFIDGAVTRLSPYISRGVISTKQILQTTLDRGYDPRKIEKFIQELAWRDYWQQAWIALGDKINYDIKQEQQRVSNHQIPKAVVEANTGIEAIDSAIRDFYETGYLHNHVRMYIASIACNIGQSHWLTPARWMYYHLLDGDWASNALSWQWVAGANSRKKFVANQENVNRYCHTSQKNTFMDVPYERFESMNIPEVLEETTVPELKTTLPETNHLDVDPEKPTLLFTFYNLDPLWHKELDANRILLLEPNHFKHYPVSANTIGFVLKLAENIPGIQIFCGEFDEMKNSYRLNRFIYKEHPFSKHLEGTEDTRDWMFDVQGYFSSFFGFWKKGKKQLGF
jgi:deoxyribodipyrimidine photo-lyase